MKWLFPPTFYVKFPYEPAVTIELVLTFRYNLNQFWLKFHFF
jgi:hypothetical protein